MRDMSTSSAGASSSLERGRAAFARRAWSEAHAQLAAADHEQPLGPEDLEALAMSAHLIGHDPEGADFLIRAHQEYLRLGRAEQAAMSAFWLGFQLFTSGEQAKGNGWLARVRRVVDDHQLDTPIRGYLLLPTGIRCLNTGDAAASLTAFSEAVEIGARFGDRELMNIARQGQGRALIRLGRIAEGIALLDEIMIAATAGELSPPSVGAIYCSVLEACHEVFDLRRAQEWTEALDEWYASQPDLVPYRGHCLVRRSELLQLHGSWSEALDAAVSACEWLSNPPQGAVALAHYQRGEVHRLRGDYAEAEKAYRQASETGRTPHPGLALLRLAHAQQEAASIAIRRALEEAREPRLRARLLAGYVEIMLAAEDLVAAREGAEELTDIATTLGAPYLHALSSMWMGAVLVAEGKHDAALEVLRDACVGWREIGAPYEGGRVRELLALTQRALGDEDSAQMEFDVASRLFEELGATPDTERVKALRQPPAAVPSQQSSGALTSRELDVLRLIATGKTNRAIAHALHISEKTVARHVSNIFTKLGLSSRAAATAYAYQHDLVA